MTQVLVICGMASSHQLHFFPRITRDIPCYSNISMNCCRTCPAGTFKLGVGSGVCTACPPPLTSQPGSTVVADCFCNGGTGPINGVCSPCEAGKYIYQERVGKFQDLLLSNRPHIVSDAANWNSLTQRFDNTCANQTCAGNTGYRELGTVTTGTVQGNGATMPVTFVMAIQAPGCNGSLDPFLICLLSSVSLGTLVQKEEGFECS